MLTPSPAEPTPTARPPATATPVLPPSTPAGRRLFLPLLLRESCPPGSVDVVFVLDASYSMLERLPDGRTKLDAARAAVGMALDHIDGAHDTAALVVFHHDAVVLRGLTEDLGAVRAALAAIATGDGTAIDRGLGAAADLLFGRQPRVPVTPGPYAPAHRAVVALLTDGRSSGGTVAAALAAADRLKQGGVEVFAIGLGNEVDARMLAAIASAPGRHLNANDADGLRAAFTRVVALSRRCPAYAVWGGRR
jgi:Mg-chelatase subunit ChlD